MIRPIFITGSLKKKEEVNKILTKFSIENVKLDLEEFQSLDIYKIARDKAKQAYKLLKKPVVIEDVAFYIEELNCFPGPLIKWMLSSMEDKGIYEISKSFKNKHALTRCVVCYFDGGKFSFFTGDVKGKIVDPKNRKAFGFDSIFMPKGMNETYSEISKEEKNSYSHRSIAWKKFEEFYISQ